MRWIREIRCNLRRRTRHLLLLPMCRGVLFTLVQAASRLTKYSLTVHTAPYTVRSTVAAVFAGTLFASLFDAPGQSPAAVDADVRVLRYMNDSRKL